MLLARATSELCRVLFPDVVKGLGHIIDDESVAAGFDDWAATETGTPPEPEKQTTTVRRRGIAGAKAVPTTAQGAPVETTELPDDGYQSHPVPGRARQPEIPTPQGQEPPEDEPEWPDGISQPALPLDALDGDTEPAADDANPSATPPASSR
jgi:hypothetical protein